MESLYDIRKREILNSLRNDIESMLSNYSWRFNTKETRNEIKSRIDSICENHRQKRLLYDYRNIMDETNNPPYVKEAQRGVIDTYLEVDKGMGIVVLNCCVLPNGIKIQNDSFEFDKPEDSNFEEWVEE